MSIQPTFFFLNGLENFVTVDIFMMSVNKKKKRPIQMVVWTFIPFIDGAVFVQTGGKVMVLSILCRIRMNHNVDEQDTVNET